MDSLKEKLRAFPYWLYILRGIAIYFMTLLIKSLMGVMVIATYSDFEMTIESGILKIPTFVVMIIYFVGAILLLNSILYLFCTNQHFQDYLKIYFGGTYNTGNNRFL